MTEIIRVLRVLEYIGEREIIEDNLNKRWVKGTHEERNCKINESILGETAEVLSTKELPQEERSSITYLKEQIALMELCLQKAIEGEAIDKETEGVIEESLKAIDAITEQSSEEELSTLYRGLIYIVGIVTNAAERAT